MDALTHRRHLLCSLHLHWSCSILEGFFAPMCRAYVRSGTPRSWKSWGVEKKKGETKRNDEKGGLWKEESRRDSLHGDSFCRRSHLPLSFAFSFSYFSQPDKNATYFFDPSFWSPNLYFLSLPDLLPSTLMLWLQQRTIPLVKSNLLHWWGISYSLAWPNRKSAAVVC